MKTVLEQGLGPPWRPSGAYLGAVLKGGVSQNYTTSRYIFNILVVAALRAPKGHRTTQEAFLEPFWAICWALRGAIHVGHQNEHENYKGINKNLNDFDSQ